MPKKTNSVFFFIVCLIFSFGEMSPAFSADIPVIADCEKSAAEGGRGGVCKNRSFGGCDEGIHRDIGDCQGVTNTSCCVSIPGATTDPRLTASECQSSRGSCVSTGPLGGIRCTLGDKVVGTCIDGEGATAGHCCVPESQSGGATATTPATTTPPNTGAASGGATGGNAGNTGAGGATTTNTGATAASGGGFRYTLLEPIPGQSTSAQLPEYIRSLYNATLVIITLSAVLMLSIGGFWYLTSAGNTSRMSEAKNIIFDAIIGLVLAFVAWLILYVINPDLVRGNFASLGSSGQVEPAPAAGSPPPTTAGQICNPGTSSATTVSGAISQKASEVFFLYNVPGSGDCKSTTGGSVSPSSSLDQLRSGQAMTRCFKGCNLSSCASTKCSATVAPSETMMNALVEVGKQYRGKITIQSIAGGSHKEDSAHYSGKAVDLTMAPDLWAPVLAEFIKNGAAEDRGNRSGSFCETRDGEYINCLGRGSGTATSAGTNHLHVVFP